MHIRNRAFGISIVGVVAALLVGSAVAVAGGPGHGARSKPLVAGVHAEISLVRADGSKDAFVVDRGEVTAESQSSFAMLRKDGVSVTVGLTPDTKVRGDIQVGKGAIAFSRGGTAFAVLAPHGVKPAALGLPGAVPGQGLERFAHPKLGILRAVHADIKGIRADKSTFSFSFDRGDVTAVSATSVTLKRADGVSVLKTIDANTKVRGKLAAGGKAAIVSEGSLAKIVLARAPRA